MAKTLKPGQLCMIDGHLYRCKKAITCDSCEDCEKANHSDCILIENSCKIQEPIALCIARFGFQNYPVLIK